MFGPGPLVFHRRPDLDWTSGPFPGHLLGLLAVLHVDDREAADDLLGLDEGAVGHDCLPVLSPGGPDGLRALALLAPDDLAAVRVLVEPAAGRRHGGLALIRRLAVPTILVLRGTDEKQHELHGQPPQYGRRTRSVGN